MLPKPTRGVTATAGSDDAWLPQWAVAVMVIGLASLLFVLIFGITVVFTNDLNISFFRNNTVLIYIFNVSHSSLAVIKTTKKYLHRLYQHP